MKNLIVFIATLISIIVALTLFLFLVGSFVEGSFDFLKWERDMRGFISVLWFVLVSVILGVYLTLLSDGREEQLIKTLREERQKIEDLECSLLEKNSVEREYISLFESYRNDDWDRNSSFCEEIITLESFFRELPKEKLYPLSIRVKEIITEEKIKEFKSVFEKEIDTILEMRLGELFIFQAHLKYYQEGSSSVAYQEPFEYYEWLIRLMSRKF